MVVVVVVMVRGGGGGGMLEWLACVLRKYVTCRVEKIC